MALSRKDVGIKVAQAGYDVETAADYQLTFNSAWPSLQEAFDKTYHVGVGAVVTVPHNLGFYPFAFGFASQNGRYLGRIGYANLPTLSMYIGQNNIYLQGSLSEAYDVNVTCYNLDLTKQADYTQPLPSGLQESYSPDYGIKMVKPGRDISSSDLRDYIIHTRAQSPAVLSVLTEQSGVADGALYSITYTNPVGITNWVHGLSVVTGTIYESKVYQSAGFAVQSALGVSISGATYKLTYSGGTGGTIVVLRDPLFGNNDVAVTY